MTDVNEIAAPAGPPVRRLPIGVELVGRDVAHARVWAPCRTTVELVEEDRSGAERRAIALQCQPGGYFAATIPHVEPGMLYRFRLDGGERFPDPASRFQPRGPHGPSRLVDPLDYAWHDDHWRGVTAEGQVLYELHLGTFTPEGTWAAAAAKLPTLAELGITSIEMMPVADFAGRFGWGYDGVNLFAPSRLYGTPNDFRRFVGEAHRLGLGVILDVVYNHLGPDGNYLRQFSETYFTNRYEAEWGDALNFDGPDAGPVRELFLANAGYWIDEFHLDGLRLDATQSIFDLCRPHIVEAIGLRIRQAAGGRGTYVVAENEPQHAELVRPRSRGGRGLDALWNDDWHHSAVVAATGRNEAYYEDYRGTPQELVSAAKYGFLFQGQHYKHQRKRRGTPAFDLPPTAFVHFLENHDQVANSARGERLHQLTSPGRWRALTALLLLGPQTPMLFMGQEWSASTPFLFFADHEPELAALVRRGRAEFLTQFPSITAPEVRAALADPGDPATFERCRLDWSERARAAEALSLHRDLLRLRREDPVLSRPRSGGVDGTVLGDATFVLRYFAAGSGGRLLAINLGGPLERASVAEPLLAPPAGHRWTIHWTSDDPRYGGPGLPPAKTPDETWRLPAECAMLFQPQPHNPTPTLVERARA